MSPHVQVLQVLQVRHLSVTGTRPPLCPLLLPLSAGRVLRAGVSACDRWEGWGVGWGVDRCVGVYTV